MQKSTSINPLVNGSIVIWKDATWKIVSSQYAWEYENDENWLVTIPMSSITSPNDNNMENEKLGLAIDRVENMLYALNLPLPAEMHVEQFRKNLPEIVQELKAVFVEATGENPWE